jgi:hypothetical protein
MTNADIRLFIVSFGAWFRNPPLLGFAFRNNTGKIWIGLSATEPNEVWNGLNPTYKMQSGPE